MSLALVVVIIFAALLFDYLNGFHDAANSIATIVATKVLSPTKAVIWAAFFNFFAAIAFGVHVADTVGKIVNASLFTPHQLLIVILGALCGAILWNIITWYYGLPSSSSHALIGGLAGSGLMASHLVLGSMHKVLNWEKIEIIALFIVLSPLIGMILGFFNMVAIMWMFRRVTPFKVDSLFKRLQLVSAAAYSIGHGTNDAQKTMGIISLIMITAYPSVYHLLPNGSLPVALWIKLACATAIALGTATGGWRIVKTMGVGITKLRPVGGFAAETAGAATIIGATLAGIPVSTTHTITGAIVGVGATNRLSAVKWGVAGRIVWAWVLTMPLSALIAGLTYLLIHQFVK